jgi:hypothetical protein
MTINVSNVGSKMPYPLYVSVDGGDVSLLKILLASRLLRVQLEIHERKQTELKTLEKTTGIPVSLAGKHVLVIEPTKRYLFETNTILR